MKKNLQIALISVLSLICFSACSNHQEEDLSAPNITSKSTSKRLSINNDELYCSSDNELSVKIAQLHNKGLYEFRDFCEANNLSPFTRSNFSENTIRDFSIAFYEKNLNLSKYDNWKQLQEEASKYPKENLDHLIVRLRDVIYNSPKSVAIAKINDIKKEEKNECQTHGEKILVESICNIATHSYYLWGVEWDFAKIPLFPKEFEQTIQKEPQQPEFSCNGKWQGWGGYNWQHIVMADVIGGVTASLGGFTWGLFGAGALIGSAYEFYMQSMETVLLQYDSKVVIKDSYLHSYLLQQYKTDKETFYAKYGDKFDSLLY